MQNISSFFSHPMIKKLDIELDKIFKKAPHLPKKATEILAKIIPYLILVSGLLSITGGLRNIFGANDFYRIFNAWRGVPPLYFYITGLLYIVIGVVSLSAYKLIKNRELQGWLGLLCIGLLQLVMSLTGIIFLRDGLFNLVFSLLLCFYLLYEIKPEYSPVSKVVEKVKAKIKAKTKKK